MRKTSHPRKLTKKSSKHVPLRKLRRRLSTPLTTSSSKPLHVAITGGIGAGKSEALRAFARHGAATISADEIVHELIASDHEVRSALTDRFGTTDRGEIAKIVFADRDALYWLERLLHPRVVERSVVWREQQDAPLAVAEVPLLYETGGDARFDKVVVITAPKDVRTARRPTVDDDRESRLLADEEKARRADFVYLNTGSLGELDAFVADVVRKLTSR